MQRAESYLGDLDAITGPAKLLLVLITLPTREQRSGEFSGHAEQRSPKQSRLQFGV